MATNERNFDRWITDLSMLLGNARHHESKEPNAHWSESGWISYGWSKLLFDRLRHTCVILCVALTSLMTSPPQRCNNAFCKAWWASNHLSFTRVGGIWTNPNLAWSREEKQDAGFLSGARPKAKKRRWQAINTYKQMACSCTLHETSLSRPRGGRGGGGHLFCLTCKPKRLFFFLLASVTEKMEPEKNSLRKGIS